MPAERRRRDANRNMNDMQAEIEMSLDHDFAVPQQEELNHTHNLSNHRWAFNFLFSFFNTTNAILDNIHKFSFLFLICQETET